MDKFNPAQGGSFAVTNAVAATTAVDIPGNCDAIYLANTSTTAVVYFRVTQYMDATAGAGEAPTAALDMAILPGHGIVVGVGKGYRKVIRFIASAADGKVQATPGNFV